ncbi:unnamed protein product [Prorocentrum cordatum]|uniref:Secreted protein n=1 Tax=Prorocentrum cordatum TaxID=2364126 RepID=A0ABN9TEK9_9DINO|nr:unnamed protein product [Polarella glacialis]
MWRRIKELTITITRKTNKPSPVIMISLCIFSQKSTGSRGWPNCPRCCRQPCPKKTKNTMVAKMMKKHVMYPRTMWKNVMCSRGTKFRILVRAARARRWRLIVTGSHTICQRMACLRPNNSGGIKRFFQ